MNIVFIITFSLMLLGVILSLVRFVKGPSSADRVVALDTMSIIATAAFALMALVFDRYMYIDIALIYAVLGFIGVIVIARYLEGAL
ncbi:MAG: cation:proton antiporter [Bacteroidetes bacterium 4572_112]|nr:MAG: cation:proton antiporter [Bacteroidetes bacterium 4572_112]